MKYVVHFRPKARKAFLSLPKDVRDNLGPRIDHLQENPSGGDSKKLKGKLRGLSAFA